jgi:hypothetical protein
MIKLTDDELNAVMAAAKPIAVDRRDAFLQEVASALASCSEIGPGTVHRVCAAAQRQFFEPPDFGPRTRGDLEISLVGCVRSSRLATLTIVRRTERYGT